jgi:hypothetical protein
VANLNCWNRHLAKKYGKVMPFSQLPLGAKRAMIWYMAVDGEAWKMPPLTKKLQEHQGVLFGKDDPSPLIHKFILKNMDFFDKHYGKVKFGLAMVPRSEIEAALMKSFKALKSGHDTLKEWLNEREGEGIPRHKTTDFPTIFSSYKDDGLFQDGWHRVSAYLKQKKEIIPCLYYA